MAISLRRKGPSKFEQASDGSMTLIEHVRELRNRLFWASLGIIAGLIVGKTCGIFGTTYLLSRFTRATLDAGAPDNVTVLIAEAYR